MRRPISHVGVDLPANQSLIFCGGALEILFSITSRASWCAVQIKKAADFEQLATLRLSGARHPSRQSRARNAHKLCDSRNVKVRVCNELTKLGQKYWPFQLARCYF
jgi:hypothetical protein